MSRWAALIALLPVSTAACSLDYLDRETDQGVVGDYYVATNGDDARSCTEAKSAKTPKRSIVSGASCLQPGETLLVREGDYDEVLIDNLPSGKSWNEVVRIAAYPGESVWLKPSAAHGEIFVFALRGNQQYIELDGINMDAREQSEGPVLRIESWSGGNPHHIRVRHAELIGGSNKVPSDGDVTGVNLSNDQPGALGGNELIDLKIHGGGDAGDPGAAIAVHSDDNLIDGCEILDWTNAGVVIFNDTGLPIPTGNVVRNTRIHQIDRSEGKGITGIFVDGIGNDVYNNLIYELGSDAYGGLGIVVFSGGTQDTGLFNNTVYGNPFGIQVQAGTGAMVRNNIAFQNSGGNYSNGAMNTLEETNLFDDEDPLFADAAAGDFRLMPKSPAIDAGTSIDIVTTDFAGTPRPRGAGYDIGAFER